MSSSARRPSRSSGKPASGDTPLAVIDACALVPSIFFRDNLYEAIIEGRLRPVVCPEMVDEAEQTADRIMARRPWVTESDRQIVREALVLVHRLAVCVSSPPDGYAVPELGNHQKDAHLFWACEQSHADVVVTIEPRLWHSLRVWRGVPILKPTDALAWLGLDSQHPEKT